MNHPLHEEIGKFLSHLILPADCRLMLAPECGGTHNLPLFCSTSKGNDTELCNVDSLILKSGKIKFILEIDESGLPTIVGGKFFMPALTSYLIHDVLNNIPVPMDDEVMFVQVLNSQYLPAGTAKMRQGIAIECEIEGCLQKGWAKIKAYKLIYFNGTGDFWARRAELKQHIQTACGPCSEKGAATDKASLTCTVQRLP